MKNQSILVDVSANTARYFVTGAAGFVGRHVCKQLINEGFEVRAVVRHSDRGLTKLGVKIVIGDLWNEDVLQNALKDVDIIIHCAADAHFGNGMHYYKANVELTKYLIKSAKQYGKVDRFVFISTIGAIDRAKGDTCAKPLNEGLSLKKIVENVEKETIEKAIKLYGSTRKAAAILEVDQSTIVKKAKRLGISLSDAKSNRY